MNRTVVATLKIAGIGLVIAIAFAGCPGLRPRPEAEQVPVPEEVVPEVAELPAEPEEPVLSIDDTYEAISLSVQAGDPEAAIAAYQEARLQDPDDPATQVLLANLYLIAGALEDADVALATVLQTDPRNTDALFVASLIAAARGDREGQRTLLETLLAIDAADQRALASLGELQLQDGDLDAASESFSSALTDAGDNLVARMGLANVYLRQEEYEAAEEELTAVIEESPDYAFSYADRALARSMRYELTGAASDLSTAIELDPDYQWHYIDRGRVYLSQGRYQDAEADFTSAMELDDSQFITYILRGRARDAQGRTAEALSDMQNGLRLRPDYYPAYAQTATLLYEVGRYADAAVVYDGALDAEPGRLEYLLMSALSRKAAGDETGARNYLNENLAMVPRESLAYEVTRFYLLPSNDGYVLHEIQDEQNDRLRGQMYFYVGAQLALLGRDATAQATLIEAETLVPHGFLERRLATWHLRAYRSEEAGESN